MVRPCDEDEGGAHSEKKARCGHTMEKKKRGQNLKWKDACKRYTTKEAGLKENNTTKRVAWRNKFISYRVYWRSQMTGQGRDEE